MKKKLKEICSFYNGTGFPIKYQGQPDGLYPFFKVGDISKNVQYGNKILSFCDNYIDENIVKLIRGTIIPKGSIVFAKIGEAVRLNRRAITNQDCLVDNNVMALNPNKDSIDLDWFYYFMKTLDLNDYSNSTTVPSVKKSILELIEINVPQKGEQKKIAIELDTIQSAIDNKKQQLSLLDEAVKSEFVEMFGENPVGNGRWKVEKLEDISTVQTGGTPSRNHPEYFEGNIPWITTANLGKNELTYEDAMEYISQDAIDNSATKIIPANSLFIGIRVGVGKCSINRVDMCSNQDICGLSGFDTTIINLVFLKKVLDSYLDFFENAKRGTTIKGIKSDTIKKLKIFIPELNIQNQFASFVQQIDKSKFVVKQQIADLQELLDSKMQEYFGE